MKPYSRNLRKYTVDRDNIIKFIIATKSHQIAIII